jgi:FkbM family methyltransferase
LVKREYLEFIMSFGYMEQVIRRVANNLGLDITRYRPQASETGRLATMLKYHNVNLVFDVGANTGQFACALRKSGYSGKVISFEPLSSAHAVLLQVSQKDELWEIAPRVAIGDHQGQVSINVSGNSLSSSVLGMLNSHVDAAPASVYVGSEPVDLSTLDVLAPQYTELGSRSFLKIDTQGYESNVLDGAIESLRKATGIQLELSLVPLYEHQELFDTLVERVRGLGFYIWAIWPTLFNPTTGQMVQADAVFFRQL